MCGGRGKLLLCGFLSDDGTSKPKADHGGEIHRRTKRSIIGRFRDNQEQHAKDGRYPVHGSLFDAALHIRSLRISPLAGMAAALHEARLKLIRRYCQYHACLPLWRLCQTQTENRRLTSCSQNLERRFQSSLMMSFTFAGTTSGFMRPTSRSSRLFAGWQKSPHNKTRLPFVTGL
jgi:hypothetical protein